METPAGKTPRRKPKRKRTVGPGPTAPTNQGEPVTTPDGQAIRKTQRNSRAKRACARNTGQTTLGEPSRAETQAPGAVESIEQSSGNNQGAGTASSESTMDIGIEEIVYLGGFEMRRTDEVTGAEVVRHVFEETKEDTETGEQYHNNTDMVARKSKRARGKGNINNEESDHRPAKTARIEEEGIQDSEETNTSMEIDQEVDENHKESDSYSCPELMNFFET